jgi:hypothetical protein
MAGLLLVYGIAVTTGHSMSRASGLFQGAASA